MIHLVWPLLVIIGTFVVAVVVDIINGDHFKEPYKKKH